MSVQSHAFPAPAKLNLHLYITGRRSDGYHLLDTLFRFVDLCDIVTLSVRSDGVIERLSDLTDVAPEQDLTVRAARLLQQYTGCTLGVSIRVEKRIPMGGGLGGGSSNAATVLLALNQLWHLQLPRQALQELGVHLGADVPVFVFGRNAHATGIGEVLQEAHLDPAWYVIVSPPVHINTQKIFQQYALKGLTGGAGVGIMRTLETRNELQDIVLQYYPEVMQAIQALSPFGQPIMTGTGSCVFLECSSEQQAYAVYNVLPGRRFIAKGLDVHPLYTQSISS